MESDFFMEESLDMLVCATVATEQANTSMAANGILIFMVLLLRFHLRIALIPATRAASDWRVLSSEEVSSFVKYF
jgi:hypothetical protein